MGPQRIRPPTSATCASWFLTNPRRPTTPSPIRQPYGAQEVGRFFHQETPALLHSAGAGSGFAGTSNPALAAC